MHACGVAERLGIGKVIVPPAAGVGSAFGLMLAPISFDFARSYVSRLDGLDLGQVNAVYDEMEQSGMGVVTEAGVDDASLQVTRTADMRYVGQGHEVRVRIPGGALDARSLEQIQDAFDEEYRRLYGRTCEGVPVETVHWRVNVSGPRPDPGPVKLGERQGRAESRKGSRSALFDTAVGPIETPVFDRYRLDPGFETEGPAIVEEAESTTVVCPGWSVALHVSGTLVITR